MAIGATVVLSFFGIGSLLSTIINPNNKQVALRSGSRSNNSQSLSLFKSLEQVVPSRSYSLTTSNHLETRNKTVQPAGHGRVVVILLWTPFLGDYTWQHQAGIRKVKLAERELNCDFTSDKLRLKEADYVVFHSLDNDPLPTVRLPSHRWVFFDLEPPPYIWFNWWMSVTFNFSATYRLDAEFPQPFGNCKLRHFAMKSTQYNITDVIKRKSGLVTWLVSRCNTKSRREQYVDELKKHIQVDVFGHCGMSCPRFQNGCQEQIHAKYKFYLAFENSFCADYVTEKAFRPLISAHPIVPVVMGMANYSQILPPHSYIDVRWFTSPEKLALYMHYLDSNDTEYAKFFEWRRTYRCGSFAINFNSMCQRAHDLYNTLSPQRVSFNAWTERTACVSPDLFHRLNIDPPSYVTVV